MKMKTIIAAALVLGTFTPAHAALKTQVWLDACNSADINTRAFCLAYASGIFDGLLVSQLAEPKTTTTCLPDGINAEQVSDVTIRHIRGANRQIPRSTGVFRDDVGRLPDPRCHLASVAMPQALTLMERTMKYPVAAGLLILIIAGLVSANAQPQQLTKVQNIRTLGLSFSSFNMLGRCYAITRAISRDELADYAEVMQTIRADAQKNDPTIDPTLIEIDAINSPTLGVPLYWRAFNPAEWVCNSARINLSKGLWFRFDRAKYERLDRMHAKCADGPCSADIVREIDKQHLLATFGRYCRANLDDCKTPSE
jgi:hypothetical protein